MSETRLLDRFRAELHSRDVPIPGELIHCGVYPDLMWPPCGDAEYFMSRVTEDPAFRVMGYTRFVMLGWVIDEIRFYASRIEAGDVPWWFSGEDSARVAACEAEADEHELAIFETMGDAVTFTISYLGGVPLKDIAVPRIKPTPQRYGVR